jgi:hypothetical protein
VHGAEARTAVSSGVVVLVTVSIVPAFADSDWLQLPSGGEFEKLEIRKLIHVARVFRYSRGFRWNMFRT